MHNRCPVDEILFFKGNCDNKIDLYGIHFKLQWNLCNHFPTSCVIRQKFMVPKYFC